MIIFLIILLAAFIVFLTYNKINKSNDENLKTIKVAEVTHSTFYAPWYVAIEKGYFKEVGLDVELILTSGADNVAAAVLSNDVNIGFAGPESAIYVYNGGEKDYIQAFAGLTKRDGQFIVSRKKIKDFEMTDLENKEVLVGRTGGMPYLNFENAVDKSNANKKRINMNTTIEFADLSSAFISGSGDFVNLFEPNATLLEKQGYGYVVGSVGKFSGEVPYTTFYARKSYIKDNEKIIKNFSKALNKGIKYVKDNIPEKIAKSILNQFPDSSLTDLTTMIKRYKEADSWLDNTNIKEQTFINLEDIMIKSGNLKEYVPYKDLVNNK